MSFAKDAKIEVLRAKFADQSTAKAFLAGVIKSAGQLDITSGKKSILIYTELKDLFKLVRDVMQRVYHCEPSLVSTDMPNHITRYTIYVPADAEALLLDLGVFRLQGGALEFVDGIAWENLPTEACKIAFIKGMFVGCATSNIVIKRFDSRKISSGYHFEFILNSETLAEDFVKLLGEFNIPAKITIRKSNILVYIKEYQIICDVLALVGAPKSVLRLQNEATLREVRNNVNRQNNCFAANLSKTLSASMRQLDAIETISDTIGIDSLDDALCELCLIRLANPDEPLEQLVKLCSENISKSGINHRFQKIIKIADSIKSGKYK